MTQEPTQFYENLRKLVSILFCKKRTPKTHMLSLRKNRHSPVPSQGETRLQIFKLPALNGRSNVFGSGRSSQLIELEAAFNWKSPVCGPC